MANYRHIHQKIWDDPDFQEYPPLQKLFFIYLCTNNLTTESGIYPISPKTISRDTDIPEEEVKHYLGDTKNVKYDFKNKVVFVYNLKRYHGGGAPQKVVQSIIKDYKFIQTSLWDEFAKQYPEYRKVLRTVKEQLANGSIPIPVPIPVPVPKPTPTLTPDKCEGEREHHDSEDSDDMIPYNQMLSVFTEYWDDWHEGGTYLSANPEKDKEVAKILYQYCVKECPDEPLVLFQKRVDNIFMKENIDNFSGLLGYWNSGASSDF